MKLTNSDKLCWFQKKDYKHTRTKHFLITFFSPNSLLLYAETKQLEQ